VVTSSRSDDLSEVEDVAVVVPNYKLPRPPRLGFQRLSKYHIPALIFRVQGRHVIHSPVPFQWFEDSVMFTEGGAAFEGYLCRYRPPDGFTVAIAARSVPKGADMGPDDFMFISVDDFNQQLASFPPEEAYSLDKPIRELELLISAQDNEEAKYQQILQTYPWLFGAQYELIQPHKKLDDGNIPDLTGKRVRDSTHDIFEIKPPFTRLFNKSGEFSTEFLRYWDQAERYLNFAREQRSYLFEMKGLVFDNPRCFLIAGIELTNTERTLIKRKEKMNPSIEVYTYNDLLSLAHSTINLLRKLKQTGGVIE
jgi:hypothetical protein